MEHFDFHKKIESCFASVARFEPDAKGMVYSLMTLRHDDPITNEYFFSYNGEKFYNQANSTTEHHFTALGKFEGSPFVVSGYTLHNKTEYFDVVANQ